MKINIYKLVVTIFISVASLSVYPSEQCLLDSDVKSYSESIDEGRISNVASKLEENDSFLSEAPFTEQSYLAEISEELAIDELESTLSESLVDVGGIVVVFASCAAEIPKIVKVSQGSSSGIHKASVYLKCIPIIGDILGFVDDMVKRNEDEIERQYVNKKIEALNKATTLELNDSGYKQHKEIVRLLETANWAMNRVSNKHRQHQKKLFESLEEISLIKMNSSLLNVRSHYSNSVIKESNIAKIWSNNVKVMKRKCKSGLGCSRDDAVKIINAYINSGVSFNDGVFEHNTVKNYHSANNHIVSVNIAKLIKKNNRYIGYVTDYKKNIRRC